MSPESPHGLRARVAHTLRGKRRLLLGALVVASVLTLAYHRMFTGWYVHSFVRPDGRYRVDVYGLPSFGIRMPGSGSDGPGYLVLRDREGHELGRAPLEMIQNAEEVEWTPRHARVKLVAEWDLPD